MEFRIKKRTGTFLIGLALLAPAMFAQQEFRYEARRRHCNKGELAIGETGISFEETYKDGKHSKHPHAWRWAYQDIQQLKMAPKSLTVLTYKDNKWKLGADRAYEFDLVSDKTFENAYRFLTGRLDQRFVAAIPDRSSAVLWEIPVKHLLRVGGDEGMLRVGSAEIVYQSEKAGESRTWRYQDIENVSTSGPFQLTITTFERATTHYGNLKGFNFELKQQLDEAQYNDLWLRLNRSKGLQVLSSYRESAGAQ